MNKIELFDISELNKRLQNIKNTSELKREMDFVSDILKPIKTKIPNHSKLLRVWQSKTTCNSMVEYKGDLYVMCVFSFYRVKDNTTETGFKICNLLNYESELHSIAMVHSWGTMQDDFSAKFAHR